MFVCSDGANSRRFVRKATPTCPLVASINNPISAGAHGAVGPNNRNVELVFEGEDKANYPPEAFVPAEVKAGSLVLIHGEVVHQSEHNHSNKVRETQAPPSVLPTLSTACRLLCTSHIRCCLDACALVQSRYIYTFHLIDQHGTTYPATNWLQSATKFPTLLEQ